MVITTINPSEIVVINQLSYRLGAPLIVWMLQNGIFSWSVSRISLLRSHQLWSSDLGHALQERSKVQAGARSGACIPVVLL